MTPIERLWMVMIKPWAIIICILFLMFSYHYLDKPIANYFYSVDLISKIPVLNWITKLGLGQLYYIPLFLIALFFRYIVHNKKLEMRAWFLWLCVAIPSFFCLVFKMILGRARPYYWLHDDLFGFYWFKFQAPYWSFPSGHTSTVMGFVIGLTLLMPNHSLLFLLLGAGLALTRVLLFYHYITDVLVAMVLAFYEIGLLIYWLREHNKLIFSASKPMSHDKKDLYLWQNNV